MTELGNRLKEARLEKGLSLDDVQSITKIQKRYLIGIEEGNYSSMPGNFYVRAFIKQYAEALSLNPDEVFENFKGEIPSTHTEDLPQQLSRVKTHKTVTGGNSKIFDVLPKILIVVFIVGVASLLYVFLYNHAGKDTNESVSKENEPVKYVKSKNLDTVKEKEIGQKATEKEKDPAKQVEETPVVEAPKQEITVVDSSGRNTTYSLNNTDKFVVKLVSRGNSWVSIKNGKGKSFFEGTLVKGATESTTVDLTAESEARLIVGRTVDTDIYVNDQKIDYQVPPNEKVRQDITIKHVPKTE